MNVKLFLAIAAVVSILYGIAFTLVPALLLATYGMATEASTVLAARYFGLTLLGLGLIAWFVKDTSDRRALRGLLVKSCNQCCRGRVRFYLGKHQRHNERNGLVGSTSLRRLARVLRLLPVR